MNTFKSVFEHYNWDDPIKIYATTTKQVEQALAKTKEIWMTFSTDISCSPTLS
jgi:hypothetical protein